MGKKGKVGKQRKDKYYQLAKETGYRSRAAFKLIQLNRKFEFLQRSKVLIDLCAAPGGWLQVAQKFMPVSSVIVGVDLVSIKPIHNVITLQEDITTQKCRTQLKKNLKTWKADVVLHDGAPNVGKSWIHDAFEQNRLTLSALHLACDFLIKGGWFVTKVFRSKDYNSLIWVLNKLFKKVFATKPQASRNESAEIFIVCQNFIAPDKIDPKFFDPSHVFADLKEEGHKITPNDLLKASTKMKKAKAEGYEDGQTILYNKLNASEFIEDSNYAELLSKASEIVLDTDFIKNHPSTTNEIVECIQDIKVLGRKELMLLINWRRNLRNELKKMKDRETSKQKKLNENEQEIEKSDDDIEEIDSFENEEALKLKRKKKKEAKEKRKLAERMNLKMVLENDQLVQEEQDLFSLNKIEKRFQVDDVEPNMMDGDDDENDQEETRKIKKILYDKDSDERYLDSDEDNISDIEQDNLDDPVELENGQDETFDNESMKIESTPKDPFFDKPIFQEFLWDEEEENIELQEIENLISKGKNTKIIDQTIKMEKDEDDSDEEENLKEDKIEHEKPSMVKAKKQILTKEELTMGSILIKSKKSKRDLLDDGWNRYMHDDIDLAPDWFRKEEETYCRKPLPVLTEHIQRIKNINSRPIKKELEAKARKKKRTIRRLEKARIKAESLTDDPSMSNKEKADTIRRIYQKASKKNDKKPKLVVAKKQYGNRRPPGVKGRYKIVDARMKKDKRKLQNNKTTKNKNKNRSRKQRSK